MPQHNLRKFILSLYLVGPEELAARQARALPAGPPLSNLKDLHFPRKELPSHEQPWVPGSGARQPHFVPERFLSLSQIFHERHLVGVLLCLVHVSGRYCSQAVLFMLWYEFSLLHFSIPNTHRGDVPCFVTHCTRGLTADCCEQPCFEHLCVVLQTNFSLLLSVSLGVEWLGQNFPDV